MPALFGAGGAGAAGAAASLTPWGAAASALGAAISTPNTSASGDITGGKATFGNVGAGVNFGMQIPPYVWIGAAVVGAFLLLRRRK